ncbi:SRPBCC family protein [Prauserella oleivorans]|uniref:SRPBCC family protein n=1 Tax=Prauserella oleivorans TaxID=1478153 RepID=A0ABW5WC52_9PSEU
MTGQGHGVPHPDGLTAECELLVAADAATVWELVTDIHLPARFSPELRHVRWLDDAAGPRLGATFEGHNENGLLGAWRTVSVVTELDAPRAFEWAVCDADGRFGPPVVDPASPMARWRFDLTPADGGTSLRHWVRLGPARSGISLAVDRAPDRAGEIVQQRLGMLRNGMASTLRGVRDLAQDADRP